jgi:PAS domain S-box-containing protein
LKSNSRCREKTYRRLFEFSPYGILIVQDGKILMHNSEVIKLVGYKEDKLKDMYAGNIVS